MFLVERRELQTAHVEPILEGLANRTLAILISDVRGHLMQPAHACGEKRWHFLLWPRTTTTAVFSLGGRGMVVNDRYVIWVMTSNGQPAIKKYYPGLATRQRARELFRCFLSWLRKCVR